MSISICIICIIIICSSVDDILTHASDKCGRAKGSIIMIIISSSSSSSSSSISSISSSMSISIGIFW